jgi:hypothetical protein
VLNTCTLEQLVLPELRWSRRVRGEFANVLAEAEPSYAHAVLSARQSGEYAVSVRAPLMCSAGADRFCRRFGGNGRVAAAGAKGLARDRLEEFIRAFCDELARSP